MKDSLINVSLIKKEDNNLDDTDERVEIFDNIASKFCKTAAD